MAFISLEILTLTLVEAPASLVLRLRNPPPTNDHLNRNNVSLGVLLLTTFLHRTHSLWATIYFNEIVLAKGRRTCSTTQLSMTS